MWQPYFAGVGWNPFMDGAWSWYPGMGFMWASAYPWGWMPYYYGNWAYAPGLAGDATWRWTGGMEEFVTWALRPRDFMLRLRRRYGEHGCGGQRWGVIRMLLRRARL